jgi:hypothetical protein
MQKWIKTWVFTASLATSLAASLPASAAGALATGAVPDGRYAWAARDRTDFSPGTSADQITAAAVAECNKTAATAKASGEVCQIVLHYDDQCFAIAASKPSGHRLGYAKAADLDAAKRDAMAMCADNARAINESCQVLGAFCDR